MKARGHVYGGAVLAAAVVWNLLSYEPLSGQASPASSNFQVIPFWPKPLPNDWVTGNVGGTCVDSNDHVFIVSRTADPTNLTAQAERRRRSSSSIPKATWSTPGAIPNSSRAGIHDCIFDHEGNLWIGGHADAIAQTIAATRRLLGSGPRLNPGLGPCLRRAVFGN